MQDKLKVGSIVYLKAEDDPKQLMTVEQLSSTCDGTSHDGQGVLCVWFEETELHRAWLSESSLVLINE
jgi:uncharacterized protein YodC (DUF2158 family)